MCDKFDKENGFDGGGYAIVPFHDDSKSVRAPRLGVVSFVVCKPKQSEMQQFVRYHPNTKAADKCGA